MANIPNAIPERNELTLYAWDNMDLSGQNVIWYHSESYRDSLFAKQSENGVFQDQAVEKAYDYSFVSGNKIRVPFLITYVQGFNYLRYYNTDSAGAFGAGTHRVYAFITDLKWINNKCTEITFEIDYWTTFQPFITLKKGYIVRTHINKNDDKSGKWLETEPFARDMTVTRTVMTDPYTDVDNPHTKGAVYAITTWENNEGGTPIPARWHSYNGGRLWSGLKIWNLVIPEGVQAFEAEISDHPDLVDGVVAVYCGPLITEQMTEKQDYTSTFGSLELSRPVSFDLGSESYVPKNNKVFNYPYVYAEASTPTNSVEYAFELSSLLVNDQASDPVKKMRFLHIANYVNNISVMGYPVAYGGRNEDLEKGVTVSGFPKVAYVDLNYAQWLDHNNTKMMWSQLTNVLSTIASVGAVAGGVAAGAMSGGVGAIAGIAGAGSIMNSAQNLVNIEEEKRIAKQTPSHQRGTLDSNILWNINELCIKYSAKTILPDQAREIDEYLTRYGYSYNRIDDVAAMIQTRPKFNYIQTKNYEIGTGYFVPAIAKRYIETLFDRGVTIWHSFTGVGDYDNNDYLPS